MVWFLFDFFSSSLHDLFHLLISVVLCVAKTSGTNTKGQATCNSARMKSIDWLEA